MLRLLPSARSKLPLLCLVSLVLPSLLNLNVFPSYHCDRHYPAPCSFAFRHWQKASDESRRPNKKSVCGMWVGVRLILSERAGATVEWTDHGGYLEEWIVGGNTIWLVGLFLLIEGFCPFSSCISFDLFVLELLGCFECVGQ